MKKTDQIQANSFREKVLEIVGAIPSGETLSYGDVAKRAGSPRAARAVGALMAANRDRKVPCHRVIRADGTFGGYNGLRGDKSEILAKELSAACA